MVLLPYWRNRYTSTNGSDICFLRDTLIEGAGYILLLSSTAKEFDKDPHQNSEITLPVKSLTILKTIN